MAPRRRQRAIRVPAARTVLAIDQGTTGTTALVVGDTGAVLSRGYAPLPQHYPRPGWVEHDPEEIWESVQRATAQALGAGEGAPVAAVGITNQRETTVVWDRRSGSPVAPAIVWQCRRTAARCDELRRLGRAAFIQQRTGLVLDAYFSATKIQWLLEHVPGLRARAAAGDALFGTVDSWLIWKLTGGATHATDASNASRTLLLDLDSGTWAPDLLAEFDVPASMLPAVVPSASLFGETVDQSPIPPGIPITGVAGDQQAALFGQGCYAPGMAKTTFGTGCFLLLNTGTTPRRSHHRLLGTIAWQLGKGSARVYALEGSVFVAGAVVQWLRDELGLVTTAAETADLAASVPDAGGVYLVPAFTGLGAPHWDQDARGLITGLTRGTTRAHVVRAALEGIAHQVADVVEAMEADAGFPLAELRVDGGAAANDFLMQFQADLLNRPVLRPALLETTAYGAALLAGIGVGLWPGVEALAGMLPVERRFEPRLSEADRQRHRDGWREAVQRARSR